MDGIPGRLCVNLAMMLCWILAEPSVGNLDAKRLYDDLIVNSGYNKLIQPPTRNSSGKLVVKLGLKLSQLIDVDEKNQILTTNVWIIQEWEDISLSWNPNDYGGVSHLYVPPSTIWLPDIVLFNNADGNYEGSGSTKATINYTGRITWNPPAVFKSSCDIKIEFFPFDEQECFLMFGSWTYDGEQIDIKHRLDKSLGDESKVIGRGISLDKDFYKSAEWDVMGVPASKLYKVHDGIPEPYITFNITIRRKTLFYTVNLIIPCVSLCFLTGIVFYLPSNSREKMTLCINILLSLTVFFLLLSEIIPPTSLVVPLIGKYLLFTMFMVTVSVIVTVVVLNVHYRSQATHDLPWWVRKIFLEVLPKVLIMRRPKLAEFVQRSQRIKSMRKMPQPPQSTSYNKWNGAANVVSVNEKHPPRSANLSPYNSPKLSRSTYKSYGNIIENDMKAVVAPGRQPEEELATAASNRYRGSSDTAGRAAHIGFERINEEIEANFYTPEAHRAIEGIRYIAMHLMDEDEDRKVREEWKYIALVIDRLFLWVFGGMSVIGTFVICLRAPVLFDKKQPIQIESIEF